MGDPPLAADGFRFTERLRLEPVGPVNALDLWLVHDDDDVWPWYGNEKPGFEQTRQRAKFMGESWDLHGVHKWIAYDRASGEVVGRGGLSRTPVDDDWGRGYASEIGRAGLEFAFNVLGARAVVSCTVRHNVRSRAVMERIGMRYAGEIRSRGMVEGMEGEQDDAPFAVCVLLRDDRNGSAVTRRAAGPDSPASTDRNGPESP